MKIPAQEVKLQSMQARNHAPSIIKCNGYSKMRDAFWQRTVIKGAEGQGKDNVGKGSENNCSVYKRGGYDDAHVMKVKKKKKKRLRIMLGEPGKFTE